MIQTYIPTVATLMLIGIGILFNNSRFSDLNTTLNKRIDDLRSDHARLENVVVSKLTEVESRLARIEAHLNLR